MPDTGSLPAPATSSPTNMLALAFLAWFLLSVLPYIIDAASNLEIDTTYWVSVCCVLAVAYGLGRAVERKKTTSPESGKHAKAKEMDRKEEPENKDATTQTESTHQTASSSLDSSRMLGSNGKTLHRKTTTETKNTRQHERVQNGESDEKPAEPAKRAVKHASATKPYAKPNKRRRSTGSFTEYSRVPFLGAIFYVCWSRESVFGYVQDVARLREWTKEHGKSIAARPTPRLLQLPPELRNQIWRLVLLSSQPILVITPAGPLVEPGLLRTSKALRNEAIGIFYEENVFHVPVGEFDHSTLMRWMNSSPFRAKQTTKVLLSPSTNWANLMKWLKDTLEYKSVGIVQMPLPGNASNCEFHFTGLLFKVLGKEKEKGRSWQEVEALLEEFREAAGIFDVRWRARAA